MSVAFPAIDVAQRLTQHGEESNLLLPMIPVQNLCIEGAPGPQRFEREMHKLFAVDLAIEQPKTASFKTQITAYCGRKLRFAALRFSPHFTRSQQFRRPTRWLVTLQREGSAQVAQDGRSCSVQAGDMFMIDPSRPFSIETDHILTHSVYLEPDALRRLIPQAEALTATAIACREGTAGLFGQFVDHLFSIADQLDEPAADHLAEALPMVLSAALSSRVQEQALVPSRMQALHRQRILGYVRDNLRNSALDANEIAQAVNLSTRYLYELFAGDGEPLMKRIWSERLERCRNDLAAPAMRLRSIGEIAYYWGFNDVAHFSRSFKQRFGASPREYRQRHALACGAGPRGQSSP